MGAYCSRALIPHHTAQVGEVMEVLWSDYYGAAIFGDGREIACIPHTECWFEITETPETEHRKVTRLLPGHVIRYTYTFGDRFELRGGTRVRLQHLVGFKLQRIPSPMRPIPTEDDLVERNGARPRELRQRLTLDPTVNGWERGERADASSAHSTPRQEPGMSPYRGSRMKVPRCADLIPGLLALLAFPIRAMAQTTGGTGAPTLPPRPQHPPLREEPLRARSWR